MKFHSFLIKYGEIGIKGKNRYMFEDALVRQIRYALADVEGDFYVHKCHGRVYVDCNGEYDYEETVEHTSTCLRYCGNLPGCTKRSKRNRRAEKGRSFLYGRDVPGRKLYF